MHPDVYAAMDQIARGSPLEGSKVWSYRQCRAMLCYGGISIVDIEDVREGAKYVIRADGKGGVPHCVSILAPEPEVANIYDVNTVWEISAISIRGIPPDSVDKPILLEFPDSEEYTESGQYASCESNYILDTKHGPELRIIRIAERASVFFIFICKCKCQMYITNYKLKIAGSATRSPTLRLTCI